MVFCLCNGNEFCFLFFDVDNLKVVIVVLKLFEVVMVEMVVIWCVFVLKIILLVMFLEYLMFKISID